MDSVLIRGLHKGNWMWAEFWMRFSGPGRMGRLATRIGTLFIPPYYERHRLARQSVRGYFAPDSACHGRDIRFGRHVFLDDRVLIYQGWEGAGIVLGDEVHLHRDCVVQTGSGGSVRIGSNSKIQLRCHFSAYVRAIIIGENVQIAPNCSFFSYNHAVAAGTPINRQPLYSRGDIVVGDDAWIGAGVILLDGVTVGPGAVIAAGSVVAADIPANAIAAGVPAQVKKYRQGTQAETETHGRASCQLQP